MSENVGVVGLKRDEIAAIPNHTWGAPVSFYEGNLADIDAIHSFCGDKSAVFALGQGLSTSTLHALPRKNLYTLGSNVGIKGLLERLEKKYGIVERGEIQTDVEHLEKLERRYVAPAVEEEEPADPYGLPETWRSCITTDNLIVCRYPNDNIVIRTVDYVWGQREDFGYLKSAYPGTVVRYGRSSNEEVASAERRAAFVVENWPERVGYMIEAHIHRDYVDYYITGARVMVSSAPRTLKFFRDVPEVRKAMAAWDRLKDLFDDKPDPVTLATVVGDEIEGITVAVDDDIVVPDSPPSGENPWPDGWMVSMFLAPACQYRPGITVVEALSTNGRRYDYSPLSAAVPGQAFCRQLESTSTFISDIALKMRYPMSTYAPKCGYVIEAHVFGDMVIYHTTDIPFDGNKHREFNQITSLTDLETLRGKTSSNTAVVVAPTAAVEPAEQEVLQFEPVAETTVETPSIQRNPTQSTSIDVDFWKQIYALSFQTNGNNATALLSANQALKDLASIK